MGSKIASKVLRWSKARDAASKGNILEYSFSVSLNSGEELTHLREIPFLGRPYAHTFERTGRGPERGPWAAFPLHSPHGRDGTDFDRWRPFRPTSPTGRPVALSATNFRRMVDRQGLYEGLGEPTTLCIVQRSPIGEMGADQHDSTTSTLVPGLPALISHLQAQGGHCHHRAQERLEEMRPLPSSIKVSFLNYCTSMSSTFC